MGVRWKGCVRLFGVKGDKQQKERDKAYVEQGGVKELDAPVLLCFYFYLGRIKGSTFLFGEKPKAGGVKGPKARCTHTGGKRVGLASGLTIDEG
jgi:hypothetical protein